MFTLIVSDLRSLKIDLKFSHVLGGNSAGNPVDFISKVTKLVALKRTFCKDPTVSGDLQPVSYGESEDEDYYDDSDDNGENEDVQGGEDNEGGEQGED